MSNSKYRLLVTSKTILRLLMAKDLTTNNLQEQTTTDKSFFYEVRNKLKKEKLIIVEQLRGPKGAKGFELVHRISEHGKQIAEIINGIEVFKKRHIAFREKRINTAKLKGPLKENREFDNQGNKIPLSERRLIDNEFNLPIVGAQTLEILSFEYFNNVIFYKCSQIPTNISRQDTTKLILDDIIATVLHYYLEEINHIFDTKDEGFINGLGSMMDAVVELPTYSARGLLLTNPLIGTETIGLLQSLFDILKPPKESINKVIKDIDKHIKIRGPSRSDYIPQIANMETGISFYKEYLEHVG